MRKILIVARILTWFNLIFWTGFLGLALLSALTLQAFPVLLVVVLFCSIPLHNYAALQLQKAIRFPNSKLSQHTPAGIRFVGLVALFFGVSMVINSFAALKDSKATLDMLRENMPNNMKTPTDAQLYSALHFLGICGIVVGSAVTVNVILNSRLLRWYYLVKRSQDRKGDDRNGQSPA